MPTKFPPRVWFGRLLACAVLVAACIPAVWAEPGAVVAISISDRAAQLDDALRHGHALELERRWADAVLHYEEAIRKFPDEAGLKRRFDYARMHYDLGRRYADRSFRDAVANLSAAQALELYAQVLVKIQAHYVEAPHWKEAVERGTNHLEVALGEPEFAARHVPHASRATIDATRSELRRTLGPRTIASRSDAADSVSAAARLAEQRLGIRPAAVILEYLCGAANSLDAYSAYLTPDQLHDVYAQIDGNFVGLGIELKAQDGALLIVRVISGSPADQGGIRPGDRILAVDGQPTRELSTDQAANLLQGEEGSVVELLLGRPGDEARRIVVRRRRVDVPSIERAEIVDSEAGVALCRLTCFQKTTARDLETALWKLHREGMRSLIVDLRGNPGGLLATAVEAADLFLDRGIIVSTHGRGVQEDFTYSAHLANTWRVPLVVLIDRDSASAAEIFAGAVRDHRRGTIIGQRSYGKGSVQGIFPLEGTASGIRLTTAKFYSPAGRSYSGTGVDPDMLIHQAARPIEGRIAAPSDDAVLAAALVEARKLAQPDPQLTRAAGQGY